jgi:hypothetical protein
MCRVSVAEVRIRNKSIRISGENTMLMSEWESKKKMIDEKDGRDNFWPLFASLH